MKMARASVVLPLLLCGALAFAHAHLQKSVPADGSVVATMPPNFVLTFAEPARLTALTLQKGSEPDRKLGPLPGAPAPEFSIPAPRLAPGLYVVRWRVVSDDGHVMSGKIAFTVKPPGA